MPQLSAQPQGDHHPGKAQCEESSDFDQSGTGDEGQPHDDEYPAADERARFVICAAQHQLQTSEHQTQHQCFIVDATHQVQNRQGIKHAQPQRGVRSYFAATRQADQCPAGQNKSRYGHQPVQ